MIEAIREIGIVPFLTELRTWVVHRGDDTSGLVVHDF